MNALASKTNIKTNPSVLHYQLMSSTFNLIILYTLSTNKGYDIEQGQFQIISAAILFIQGLETFMEII